MGPLEPSTLAVIAVVGVLSGVLATVLGPKLAKRSPRDRALLVAACALLVAAIMAWVIFDPI